jgi:N-acetylmuramoyl-L-alanine amidase
MENVLYFISVSLCTGVFYVVYITLFRNSPAFKMNRIYLLAGMIFSFVIPAVDLSFVPLDYHLDATVLLPASTLDAVKSYRLPADQTTSPTFFSMLPILYWGGLVFAVFRLLHHVVWLMKMKNSSKVSKDGMMTIVHADIAHPFSFINMIFLPRGGVNPLVLEHEKAHVRHRHWIDLVLTEVAGAVLWFNPIIGLYRKSIRIQHEYEADAETIINGASLEKYLDCILRHLGYANQDGLLSPFHSQNIKQRILMMTRTNTSQKSTMLYLLCLPLVCGLLLAFSTTSHRTEQVFQSIIPSDENGIVLIVDAGHGGHDIGAYGNGVNEKDLTLAIAKSIQEEGKKAGVKVILTRTGDDSISLEERVSIVSKHRANAFLSVHINKNDSNPTASGIDVLINNNNNQADESIRLAEQLKNELSTLGAIKLNNIQNSNSYVLSKTSIPAIILELGYLSNSEDTAFLTLDRNQKLISERIISAIVQYTK